MKTWEGKVCLVRRMMRHGEFLHYYVAVAVERPIGSAYKDMVLVLTISQDFGPSNSPFFIGQEVSGKGGVDGRRITFWRNGYRVLEFTFELVDERDN